MTISQEIRTTVRRAYHSCCGYCGVSELSVGGELEIDHFQPLTQGGIDSLDNLVYACTTCNRFKSDYWPDNDAPDSLKLLHPGREDTGEHIVEAVNGRMVGLTPRGWFHINWLHLNRPQLVELRRLRQNEQAISKALTQAEEAQRELQRRILELQAELTELRNIIAQLT